MSITASEMTPADIAAVTNGGGNSDGFGDGNGAWWLIVLFLFALGGWGNNGFGGGASNGGAGGLYPWMNQAEITSDGFRDQMMNNNITSIRDGIGNLSTQLCNCCSDVQMSLANGFAGIEQGANARQMANMNQIFGLQSQFADCCCENRLGIANLNSTILAENCADRQALSDGVRDIIQSQTASTQAILDKLCQQEIEAKNDTIAQLRSELLYSRGQASQDVQTARILAGQTAEVDALYNRLDQCPVGTTPVYGRTPIFTCNTGCGCNNGCGM